MKLFGRYNCPHCSAPLWRLWFRAQPVYGGFDCPSCSGAIKGSSIFRAVLVAGACGGLFSPFIIRPFCDDGSWLWLLLVIPQAAAMLLFGWSLEIAPMKESQQPGGDTR